MHSWGRVSEPRTTPRPRRVPRRGTPSPFPSSLSINTRLPAAQQQLERAVARGHLDSPPPTDRGRHRQRSIHVRCDPGPSRRPVHAPLQRRKHARRTPLPPTNPPEDTPDGQARRADLVSAPVLRLRGRLPSTPPPNSVRPRHLTSPDPLLLNLALALASRLVRATESRLNSWVVVDARIPAQDGAKAGRSARKPARPQRLAMPRSSASLHFPGTSLAAPATRPHGHTAQRPRARPHAQEERRRKCRRDDAHVLLITEFAERDSVKLAGRRSTNGSGHVGDGRMTLAGPWGPKPHVAKGRNPLALASSPQPMSCCHDLTRPRSPTTACQITYQPTHLFVRNMTHRTGSHLGLCVMGGTGRIIHIREASSLSRPRVPTYSKNEIPRAEQEPTCTRSSVAQDLATGISGAQDLRTHMRPFRVEYENAPSEYVLSNRRVRMQGCFPTTPVRHPDYVKKHTVGLQHSVLLLRGLSSAAMSEPGLAPLAAPVAEPAPLCLEAKPSSQSTRKPFSLFFVDQRIGENFTGLLTPVRRDCERIAGAGCLFEEIEQRAAGRVHVRMLVLNNDQAWDETMPSRLDSPGFNGIASGVEPAVYANDDSGPPTFRAGSPRIVLPPIPERWKGAWSLTRPLPLSNRRSAIAV
ncbi:hypothetical protein JHW43_001930 [Diplocarpon mali]|nr:hypothetical protein JHW43_001930 [Diplocarpon mali]